VAVGEFGGFPEFLHRLRRPAARLAELGGKRQRGGQHLAFKFALSDEHGGFRLPTAGIGLSTVAPERPVTGNGTLRPIPTMVSRSPTLSLERNGLTLTPG
jgi:hypothetical protein